MPDGSLGAFFGIDVGITDLGLLQVGTIWDGKTCKQQLAFTEQEFDVDFTRGSWRLTSQHDHHSRCGRQLIPDEVYPLNFGTKDRSQLLEFRTAGGQRLLVPCLEFYSRYYGRSGHVLRVLATYPWEEAEGRLYLPFSYQPTPGHWPIKLASNSYNADAIFLAHVLYDPIARRAAKSIYAGLDKQYSSPGRKAFLVAEPWFKGPATLIVQGRWIDDDTFLALRIAGGSNPKGARIDGYRENPGRASEAAPEGAPISRWKGGRELDPDTPGLVVNLTADDEPGHKGNVAEILNPAFRVVGEKRQVVHHRLDTAATRPGAPILNEQSEQHSAGERHGAGGRTGHASIHTEETMLQSSGAVRDVWNGLQYFRRKKPAFVTALGWYSIELGEFVIEDGDQAPHLVALKPYDAEEKERLPTGKWKWVYMNDHLKPRGVLVAFVKTMAGNACLFEIERKQVNRTAEDGTKVTKEEEYCGLVLVPPSGRPIGEWLAEVLDGIRRECGVMDRVLNHCPPTARFYRRSRSAYEEIAGHSTVVNALRKVDIDLLKSGQKRKPDGLTGTARPSQDQPAA